MAVQAEPAKGLQAVRVRTASHVGLSGRKDYERACGFGDVEAHSQASRQVTIVSQMATAVCRISVWFANTSRQSDIVFVAET